MRNRKFTVRKIMEIVSELSGIEIVDIQCKLRCKEFVRPRQVVMYLARRWTNASSPDVGRIIGHRDHTTVLYGVKTIARLRAIDPDLDALVRAAERRLNILSGWPPIRFAPPPLPLSPDQRRAREPARVIAPFKRFTPSVAGPKTRKCLRCREPFESTGAGNHVCPGCKASNQNCTGVDRRFAEAGI